MVGLLAYQLHSLSLIRMYYVSGRAKNSKDIDNNWDDWNSVKEGVAYRGGKGYYYSLYAKELL